MINSNPGVTVIVNVIFPNSAPKDINIYKAAGNLNGQIISNIAGNNGELHQVTFREEPVEEPSTPEETTPSESESSSPEETTPSETESVSREETTKATEEISYKVFEKNDNK